MFVVLFSYQYLIFQKCVNKISVNKNKRNRRRYLGKIRRKDPRSRLDKNTSKNFWFSFKNFSKLLLKNKSSLDVLVETKIMKNLHY
jgi:hypothetical protein